MKSEKKFTWCIRYYHVMSGTVSYRDFIGYTTREIREEVKAFIDSNDNYIVKVFKNYPIF